MSLLDLEELNVCFGDREVVSNLNLSIAAGETVALVGESGCGKSTVALSILRLLPKRGCTVGGRILLEGEDIAKWTDARLRKVRGAKIAMIFQDAMTALNPVWTIGDQIVEAIRLHTPLSRAAARRRAIELLDLVTIPDPHLRIDAYPHQLSGGLRQRAMIAMAVACSPRLLIADEPTTALDVTTQAQVLALIDQLKRDLSMAVLLITHDLGVVADHADRAVVMYAGRICEEAPAAAIFSEPFHPYTRRLIAARPDHVEPGARLTEINGSVHSAFSTSGCRFEPRCDLAVQACGNIVPALMRSGRHALACPIVQAEWRPHVTAQS